MLAIRAVIRIGWEVPNPITSGASNNSSRFPFSVILPSTAPTQYSVTFTVIDDSTSAKPIAGATVMFSGSEKTTGSTGMAVFKVVQNNTYTYAVTNNGTVVSAGNVTVNGEDAGVTIKLAGE